MVIQRESSDHFFFRFAEALFDGEAKISGFRF